MAAAAAAAAARAGQRPVRRDGHTQLIADDRGHLLPAVPRSKASPWGTFLGTWDMPLKIPPARLSLTSRSPAAASQLSGRLRAAAALAAACNGLRTTVTGKGRKDTERSPGPLFHSGFSLGSISMLPVLPPVAPSPIFLTQPQEPWPDAQDTEEPRSEGGQTSSEGLRIPQPSPKMPREEEEEELGAEAMVAVPLSRKLGRLDVRLKENVTLEIPASRQPLSSRKARAQADVPAEVPLSRQVAFTDLRLRDALSPQIHSTAQDTSPAQAAWAPPSRPGSVGAEAKVGHSPVHLASPGPAEADPQGAASPASSRSPSKASTASRARKATAKRDKSVSPERDGWTKFLPCSEDRVGQTPHCSTRPGQAPHARF